MCRQRIRRAACGLLLAGLATATAHAQYYGQPMPPMHPMMPMAPAVPPPGMVGMPPPGGTAMPGMGMGLQHRGAGPLAALNLSTEQRGQIAEIGNEFRAKNVALMNKIGDQFGALRALFAAEPPDAAAIGAAYGAIFDLQRQAVEAAVEQYNRQVAVLSDEQRTLWQAMRKQMLQWMMPPPSTP